jgi:6-phosphogluconolactonase (cycloisomerase 2 family)
MAAGNRPPGGDMQTRNRHHRIAIYSFALLAAFGLAGFAQAGSNVVGAVYTATNGAGGNEILVFSRDASGGLTPGGAFATGGVGTGMGLGNQGGVVLSDDERFLFAVNAGSDSVTAFAVSNDGLESIGTVPSGGVRPVSIALDRDLLYVVHAGGSAGAVDGVTGFRVGYDGSLHAIAGSFRGLSGTMTGPAQGSFTRNGEFLVVTEKATNSIDLFPVLEDGSLGPIVVEPSVGTTPFGFGFTNRGELIVSEAFGGMPGLATVTSYEVIPSGHLQVVDPVVATQQTAACWVAVSKDGRFAYTTNTGSSNLTGLAVEPGGDLETLDADGDTAPAGAGPIDLAFSRNGRFLYSLNGGDSSVSWFAVNGDGSLTPIGTTDGLPAGANGLAAR